MLFSNKSVCCVFFFVLSSCVTEKNKCSAAHLLFTNNATAASRNTTIARRVASSILLSLDIQKCMCYKVLPHSFYPSINTNSAFTCPVLSGRRDDYRAAAGPLPDQTAVIERP